MSELPKGWERATLAELGVWKGGGTPSKAHAEYWGGGIPWVSPKDMKSATIRTTVDTISAEAIQNSSTSIINAGSVLIVARSGILARTLPVAVNAVDVTVNQDMRALTPHPWILPEFVRYFLQGSERVILQGCVKDGTTVHSVELSFLMAWDIPIPPLPEQHRIVAKIEELFSELDASEESLTRARAQLGLYRQSLLKAAFQGTLTADWRAANPDKLEAPEALLARIRKEREDRYRQALEDWQTALSEWRAKGEVGRKPQKPERPAAVQLYSDISRAPTLPDGWAWFTTESAGKVETGNTPPTKNSEFFNGDVPFFKPSDLDAGYTSNQSRDHLTQLGSEVSRTFPAGSVLVTCIGATIGKTGRATIGGACNQQINFIVPDGATLSEFIFFQIVGPAFQEQIKDNASSTTLPILNKGKFCALPFAICALDEQVEIVAILAQRLSVIDSIETEITSALAKITALRQSILKKAFAGELVPQDPADEPAAALLARIRAEAPMSSPRRKKSA